MNPNLSSFAGNIKGITQITAFIKAKDKSMLLSDTYKTTQVSTETVSKKNPLRKSSNLQQSS